VERSEHACNWRVERSRSGCLQDNERSAYGLVLAAGDSLCSVVGTMPKQKRRSGPLGCCTQLLFPNAATLAALAAAGRRAPSSFAVAPSRWPASLPPLLRDRRLAVLRSGSSCPFPDRLARGGGSWLSWTGSL